MRRRPIGSVTKRVLRDRGDDAVERREDALARGDLRVEVQGQQLFPPVDVDRGYSGDATRAGDDPLRAALTEELEYVRGDLSIGDGRDHTRRRQVSRRQARGAGAGAEREDRE